MESTALVVPRDLRGFNEAGARSPGWHLTARYLLVPSELASMRPGQEAPDGSRELLTLKGAWFALQ